MMGYYFNLTPFIPLSFGGKMKERGNLIERGAYAPLKHPCGGAGGENTGLSRGC